MEGEERKGQGRRERRDWGGGVGDVRGSCTFGVERHSEAMVQRADGQVRILLPADCVIPFSG